MQPAHALPQAPARRPSAARAQTLAQRAHVRRDLSAEHAETVLARQRAAWHRARSWVWAGLGIILAAGFAYAAHTLRSGSFAADWSRFLGFATALIGWQEWLRERRAADALDGCDRDPSDNNNTETNHG